MENSQRPLFKIACSLFSIYTLMIWSMPLAITQDRLSKARSQFPDEAYETYTWETFENLPMVNDTIIPYMVDHSLLNAAVFFVTNKVRAYNGLNPFNFDPQLRSMAAFHAKEMATHKFVGHINYFDLGYATLDARATKFLADAGGENVANMFLYQYKSNTIYQSNRRGDGFEYITSGGDKIHRHTYLTFAYMLVGSWMGSPGHRENILSPEYEYLGCGLQVPSDAFLSSSIPLAYGVQNFGW